MRPTTRSAMNMERSGSQPNLSSLSPQSKLSSEMPSVTLRNKRKYCFDKDSNDQLSDIQTKMAEMMTLLSTSINEQKESSAKIKNDIASIRDEMSEIKHSICKTEQTLKTITTEHEKMKTDIQNITSAAQSMETKIATIESDVLNLKTSSTEPMRMTTEASFDMLAEITDQTLRKKNIILTGMPEPQSADYKQRQKQDKDEVLKITKAIIKDCEEPTKVVRIGKYKPNVNRAVKVCFESEQTVKIILRNRNKFKDDAITIFPDQTPLQQARFKNLKDQLKHRTENGETNLRIKYINGIPRIISSLPKNSTV